MKKKDLKDIGASVRQRLLNISKEKGEDFQYNLTRYAVERFLFRFSKSGYSGRFILKGASLFLFWRTEQYRQTRDVDFLGIGENDIFALEKTFKDICNVSVEEDSIIFHENSIKSEQIRDTQEYGGIRISVEGKLSSARIKIQLNIGFGDSITPNPVEEEMPALLDYPAPILKTYPKETFIAEKFEAMVKLGMANSRMKDFFDIWILLKTFTFDLKILSKAIRNTFNRRKTPLPIGTPVAFTPKFYDDPEKKKQWKTFLLSKKITVVEQNFDEVVSDIRNFILPVL